VGRRLSEAGVTSGVKLNQWLRETKRAARPLFGHGFKYSTHHYLLREWLAASGIDPEGDVQLCVVPPRQMSVQLRDAALDGFCAGEPWNTMAVTEAGGTVLLPTTDVLPDHPEKVLTVTRQWLNENHAAAVGLVRAVLRGCAFCSKPENHGSLAAILAQREYLNVSAELIGLSLRGSVASPRPFCPDWDVAGGTFPSATHVAWFLQQMVRWGHVHPSVDAADVAAHCVDSGPYREAAGALGIECPPDDFPKMRLRSGWYDARVAVGELKSA
jgi:two-component system, oxyanion-binding sensor